MDLHPRDTLGHLCGCTCHLIHDPRWSVSTPLPVSFSSSVKAPGASWDRPQSPGSEPGDVDKEKESTATEKSLLERKAVPAE